MDKVSDNGAPDAADAIEHRSERGSVVTRFEPPSLVYVKVEGDVGEAEARGMLEAVGRYAARASQIIVVTDFRAMRSITPAARRASVMWDGARNIAAHGVVGPSFHTRVIATLLAKAARMIKGTLPPVRFFATADEARRWAKELDQ
jgi:hypothetical protein